MSPAPSRPSPGPRVPCGGGVDVATWDFGGEGEPLLLIHPTGFHAWTWLGVAAHLRAAQRVWAVDLRGHGGSGHQPLEGYRDWTIFADDVLGASDALGLDRPAVAGHSMGGAVAILAEARAPGSFSSLYCYEPVVFPPEVLPLVEENSSLAVRTRRRRARFSSRSEALENFRSKPPFSAFADGVAQAYVEHGLTADGAGGVTLRLSPEEEAAVYEGAARHGAFGLLPGLDLPVTFAAGGLEGGGIPASLVAALAERVPSARLEVMDGLSHFGPMEDPARVAGSIAAATRSTGRVPPPR